MRNATGGPTTPPSPEAGSGDGCRDDPAAPLRVAILNSARVLGGNEHWVLDSARALGARGHAVLLLLRDGPVAREAARRALANRILPYRFEWDPLTIVSLAAALRAFTARTVVVTRARDEWAGALAARAAGAALLVNRVGLERSYPRDVKRRLLYGRWFERTIVNSRRVGERLVGDGHVPADRIRVVHDALPPGSYAEARDRAPRAGLGIPGDAPLLLSAGRLVAQKGYDHLLDAFALVRVRLPAARLAIAGEGPARGELLARAESAGLAGSVHFLGHVGEMRPLYAMADVYVQSSRNEGLSGALVEAMASGLPVVATDVGGTREGVEDGANGLLVPPGDPRALSEGILALLENPAASEAMARAAREGARSRFSGEESVSRLVRALAP
jgi:glycosyltransferase involved in cell wall biosynthesis